MMGKTIFERLEKGRPPIEKINSAREQKIQHAQKLLNWLQRWDKPTVSWQNIQNYGPRPKDRKKVVEAAEILVRNGWLIPLKPHRYDMHKWQVVRRPIVAPEIDT
jgi:hypothetical protein